MSSDFTLFEDDFAEIYIDTRITKQGTLHRIIDTYEGTDLTTEELRGVMERIQDLLVIYEEQV